MRRITCRGLELQSDKENEDSKKTPGEAVFVNVDNTTPTQGAEPFPPNDTPTAIIPPPTPSKAPLKDFTSPRRAPYLGGGSTFEFDEEPDETPEDPQALCKTPYPLPHSAVLTSLERRPDSRAPRVPPSMVPRGRSTVEEEGERPASPTMSFGRVKTTSDS